MKTLFGAPLSEYMPAAGLALCAAGFLIAANGFPPDAKRFPDAVAWVLLGLTCLDLIGSTDTAAGRTIRRLFNPSVKMHESAQPTSVEAGAVLSLAGLALTFVMLGIEITAPLYLFVSLRFRARRSLAASAAITASVSAVLWLLFAKVLQLDLYRGYLLSRL